MLNQIEYEARIDNYDEEQDILAGLAEINATAELFKMSFEESATFCLEIAEQELREAERRVRQLRAAIPTK